MTDEDNNNNNETSEIEESQTINFGESNDDQIDFEQYDDGDTDIAIKSK